jgi:hypothetical protein
VSEASDEAARMREEAEIEASRRRSDAAADAEAELAMAKQQGREMVNEARAYRERVLSELARRRELAREQIEQLLHGRDRLMQSFERARLVAVDVVAELQPLGEPDEYVNLSPTTGPVPVMVPNSPRPVDTPSSTRPRPTPDETVAEGRSRRRKPTSWWSRRGRGRGGAAVESVDADDADVMARSADEPSADEAVADGEPTRPTPSTDPIEPDVDDPESPAETRDDVVVDLFARLRADASLVAVDDELDDAEVDDRRVGRGRARAAEGSPSSRMPSSPTSDGDRREAADRRRSTSATPSSPR